MPKLRECSYLWRIGCFSVFSQFPGEKVRSIKFSAADDDLNWCLEHTVSLGWGNSDDPDVSFNLRPHCYDDLRKCESVSGNVEFYLINSRARTSFKSTKSAFTLSYDERYCYFVVALISMSHIKQFLCEDELTILCHFTYSKKNETGTISSSDNSADLRISEYRLLNDIEKCFIEDHFKDVTISVKGKKYRAHKTILATRSTVFDKMLRADMLESKNNYIDITDIEPETFEAVLNYIYTGKVTNLDESAFELLPVADKYDLGELRSMCEEALSKKISTDNAARILILADTYRAEELKTCALRFIKENYTSCKEFNDTEVWEMSARNFQLMKDIMAACCKK